MNHTDVHAVFWVIKIGNVRVHHLRLKNIAQRCRAPYWTYSDIEGDESTFHAYYSNIDKEGDRDWGRMDGRTFIDNGEVKIEGTWILDGGDGKFKGIKGKEFILEIMLN